MEKSAEELAFLEEIWKYEPDRGPRGLFAEAPVERRRDGQARTERRKNAGLIVRLQERRRGRG